ncbi:hypothetical protein BGS_1368 [Beggiatoa sp. SS]|nr:hypothetical protein BGS_1368 [Beggiatoa sp. SS]
MARIYPQNKITDSTKPGERYNIRPKLISEMESQYGSLALLMTLPLIAFLDMDNLREEL